MVNMRVKNLILGIGIVVVYALMLWQGIEAFYPSPKYDDFCKNNIRGPYPEKVFPGGVQNCTYSKQLQEQMDQCYADKGQPVFEYDDYGCSISLKECDYCQRDFEEAQKNYSKVIFIIALIAGIITLIIGYAILSVEPVGSALIGSGIWAIFYGAVWNWRNFSNIWRFLLLLVALVLLIWIALRLNKGRVDGSNRGWMFWKR